MRLLDAITLQFEETFGEKTLPYAILSHRWEEGEVSYQDIQTGRARQRKGYAKLDGCCNLARSQGFKYVWIDTCCIDKTSSAELTEAINSMFRWYQGADECYAYLGDVRSPQLQDPRAQEEFSASVWFTRGWTLQELIAPRKVLFFNRSWQYLGSKRKLRLLLSMITSIDPDILMGKTSLSGCPVAQRMAWAAKRKTTRVEDRAYSLLGIFNVHMPMLYGEGERAFQRLQEEIIKQSDDHSLFTWNDKTFAKSVLAPSPSCFKGLGDLVRIFPSNDTSQGFQLKNAGLSIQLQLIPWAMNTYLAPLRCGYITSSDSVTQSSRSSFRDYDRACLFLQQTDHKDQFIRVSVNGNDLVILSGDRIADMRNRYGLSDRQILIQQLFSESHLRPAEVGFYGFVFSFEHTSLFATGRRPRGSDVVCAHQWNYRQPIFEIAIGRHHTAGMFRMQTGHYMYFGFDREFEPLCLITTLTPRSRRFTRLEADLQALNNAETLQLLDLGWLRTQIKEGTTSGHAVLALKGERRKRVEVECSSLLLRLILEWRFSEITKMSSWHVEIKSLERNPSRNMSPFLGQMFGAPGGGLTSPYEAPHSAQLGRSISMNNDRIRHARTQLTPHDTFARSPRRRPIDFHDNTYGDDVQVTTDEIPSHYSLQALRRQILHANSSSPMTSSRRSSIVPGVIMDNANDVRVIEAPDRPSGFVARSLDANGNLTVRETGVSGIAVRDTRLPPTGNRRRGPPSPWA